VASRSTFGFQTSRLAELLGVVVHHEGGGGEPPEAPTLRQTLEARMSTPLALEPDVVDSVTAVLNRPCRELLPLAGRPLGDVLTDAATSLSALETLKDYGKALALVWEEGAEHAVAMTVYYAAIAAALTYHGRKITSRPFADLERTMELLVSTPWMTLPMVRLLSDARHACREE